MHFLFKCLLTDLGRRTELEMNSKKTKSLRVNAAQNTPISLEEEEIEDVSHFTYLGSVVSKTGGTEEDIQARINKAKGAFAMMKPIWNSRSIQLQTKLV